MDSDDDLDMSRRPDAEDQRWSSIGRILGSRMIRRSGNTMCGLHCAQEDEEREFLSLASNQGRRFLGLGLKTDSSGWMIYALKLL
jgi:hypothetical protein